jgi:hypothetical protein
MNRHLSRSLFWRAWISSPTRSPEPALVLCSFPRPRCRRTIRHILRSKYGKSTKILSLRPF